MVVSGVLPGWTESSGRGLQADASTGSCSGSMVFEQDGGGDCLSAVSGPTLPLR